MSDRTSKDSATVEKIVTMNILGKLYQEFVVDKIKSTDWEKGTDGPLVVELDTTEACNLACPGCISEDLVCHKTSFSRDRLMEIARELYELGTKAVILIGGGGASRTSSGRRFHDLPGRTRHMYWHHNEWNAY